MAIVKRLEKGSELTFAEMDGNFTTLDNRNYLASVAPVVTNDVDQGFTIGCTWNDIVAGIKYECKDATAGAAVWEVETTVLSDTKIISDTWTQKTGGATARHSQSAVVYQDKMYIFGGHGPSTMLNDVWEYNIQNDSWTQKTSGAIARADHSAVIYQDKMYIFGGSSDTSMLNDLWEYNIPNDSWTQKTSFATIRAWHSAVIYQDKMYIFGGSSDTGMLNDLCEYDITNDSWTQKTSFATVRAWHSAALYQDKMYIFGGYDDAGLLNDLWEYDITNDSWTQKTGGATVRADHSAVVYQDKMYIFGGYDDAGLLNDLWEYTITNDSWTQKTSGATIRHYHSAAISQDKMYIFGGSSPNTDMNDLWAYWIQVTIHGLSSDEVLNNSAKPGSTLTEVLDTLGEYDHVFTTATTGDAMGGVIADWLDSLTLANKETIHIAGEAMVLGGLSFYVFDMISRKFIGTNGALDGKQFQSSAFRNGTGYLQSSVLGDYIEKDSGVHFNLGQSTLMTSGVYQQDINTSVNYTANNSILVGDSLTLRNTNLPIIGSTAYNFDFFGALNLGEDSLLAVNSFRGSAFGQYALICNQHSHVHSLPANQNGQMQRSTVMQEARAYSGTQSSIQSTEQFFIPTSSLCRIYGTLMALGSAAADTDHYVAKVDMTLSCAKDGTVTIIDNGITKISGVATWSGSLDTSRAIISGDFKPLVFNIAVDSGVNTVGMFSGIIDQLHNNPDTDMSYYISSSTSTSTSTS